jgi:hypothetical protein
MVMAQGSLFRDALQVSRELIANLDDTKLDALMWDLLRAHAQHCRADLSQIRVNTQGKAKDDGCDGSSPKPPSDDEWFGAAETCWQLKAGTAGQRAELAGEVGKRIPTETLKAGGRFVVVASGSVNGVKGEEERLGLLCEEATAAGLPTERIHVIGSERLATWCNLYPAVAARFAGRPEGLSLLDDWANIEPHKATWQSTPELDELLSEKRAELDFSNSSVLHLHIQGPPGVGKTRFALELCKDAAWSRSVIYVSNASDLRLIELIDGATADLGVRLVVVADEVQPGQLEGFRNSLDRGKGRVRLITIGQCASPDPARIPSIEIKPLSDDAMSKVVAGWHPSLPREHVDFVTRFAAGYVRLARLTADAVAKDSAVDTRALLDLQHIKNFFGKMLGSQSRAALYVVAVLSRVGWTEELEEEGKAIAKHLGQDWSKVRVDVEAFQRQFGIVPRGGRYRYISPKPLAIYLAVEAWETFPELRTLPDALPSEEAKAAYYERLGEIAANPQAHKFARQELLFFSKLSDFGDEQSAKRWSALSAADPAIAVQKLSAALTASTEAERREVDGPARRDLVFALIRLAWTKQAFRDATLSLALLGEAENETWANNATGEFVNRFELLLGGTSLPYIQRLEVIDELISIGRVPLLRLATRALGRVGNRFPTRMHSGHLPGMLPEPEWRPSSGEEAITSVEQALQRLSVIAQKGEPEVLRDLLKTADELSMLLRDDAVRAFVVAFYETVREKFPEAREPLRRVIAEILKRERKYWKQLSPEELAELDALHARFEDHSLDGRLRQEVGPGGWDDDEEAKRGRLDALAAELVQNVAALTSEWGWLTSGTAGSAWYFGEALARADTAHALESALPALPARGRDLRALCGYVTVRRQEAGNDWFDRWIDRALQSQPDDMDLLFEVSWRCGVTSHTATLLAEAIRERALEPSIVGQLDNGSWVVTVPIGSYIDVLDALVEKGHLTAAIATLDRRLKHDAESAAALEDRAVALATNGAVIRLGETMTDYHWKEVAIRLLPQHAGSIAAAVLAQQADRDGGTWFAEYSSAKEVLERCVALDPAAVWHALVPHLNTVLKAVHFAIGFPTGLLDQMPTAEVLQWVEEKPEERAAVLSRLVRKAPGSGDSLMVQLLGKYGDNPLVGDAFFSAYVTGHWSGPTSQHWADLAHTLEQVAASTTLPKLRLWAQDSARKLREMQEREVQREEEEALRFQ